MAVDTDYLDDLMKSIEPAIYPDGVPGEEKEEAEEVFGEDEEFADPYEMELASIPEKSSLNDAEKEIESAIEAIDGPGPQEDDATDAEPVEDGVEQWEEIKVDSSSEVQEIELDMSMSEEEIDAMLNAARDSAKEESVSASDSDDVKDLLAMFDDDSDMQDIKETLEKSDNNIAIDQSALEEKEINIPDLDEEEEEPVADKKAKKTKKPKKAKKKAESSEDAETGKEKKKGGFFSRLFGALTEEVPEDVVVPEQLETGVTDENAQILSELDSEDKGKKKKKKKKDKKGKGSKEQPETQGDERDIREKSDDEDEDGGDKGKDKKKKKPKKEKKPKEKKEEIPEKPAKKLPKKRVRNTFILCLSILAAVILLSFFVTDNISKKNARYAFDNQEYEVAYSELYGMKLNDNDNDIYQKSKIIMMLDRKLSSYENYMQLGMKAEALNALLEGFDLYPSVMAKAQDLGVSENVKNSYNRIVSKLAEFGVSEADAEEINNYSSAVKYNKRILSIVNNTPFEYAGEAGTQEPAVSETTDDNSTNTVEDILPEEEDFLPDNPEEVFDDSNN